MKLLFVCLVTSSLLGSEIRLIYPRLEAGQDTFRYDRGLDSTFVFGHVTGFQPGMTLTCADHDVPLYSDGAFLAFLPIPWENETFGWNLGLNDRGVETSSLFFPFSALSTPVEIDWITLSEPAWFVVRERNTHTRTDVGASYHLFPDSGTALKVVATSENWLRFELAENWTGVIERRFADSLGATLANGQTRLGNGVVSVDESAVRLTFNVDRQPLFEAATETDGEELKLTVFGAIAAIDRIHYLGQSRELVQDITWSQRPYGMNLEIHLVKPAMRGYRVVTTDSTLTVEISYRDYASKSLRGKRIVLDPGHGGASDGAIGPRGNREKDVVLRWSEILEKELTAKGAIVLRTRADDTAIGLHDRVRQARDFNADVFLSLHGNALPDGENPFTRRGCGTYYYQSLSRGLAETIQEAILAKTGLPDDGILDANFAVARPTDFPAVLIEAAYMMHPDEELKLTDDKFLLDLSRGVANGLLEFFSTAPVR